MFGRQVVVTLRFPAQSRLTHAAPYRHQPDAVARALLYQPRRTYATPGRPRNVVGEPSKPVKRAVKRAAPKATAPDSPAKQKNVQKKKEATAKKTKSTAKKPAAKKAPRKEVTEEQKAAKAAAKAGRLARAKTADLKKAALSPPFPAKLSAYNFFTTEAARKSPELKEKVSGRAEMHQKFADFMKVNSAAWKQCTPAEVEHYNHLTHTAKEQQAAEFKRWVESHTPDQIELANLARARLRRTLGVKTKGNPKHWPQIHDERAAKRPVSAYIQFSINRNSSGDFNNITVPERAKLIGQEWKALNEDEKKKYQTLQKEDTKRYDEEYSSTFGHLPPHREQPQAAAAAA